jgi:uncharacterized membrane protein YhdT
MDDDTAVGWAKKGPGGASGATNTFEEDPRIRVARRGLAISWTFYSLFIAAMLGAAAFLGDEPRWLGLPRWVVVACIGVPAVFVAALIPIVERSIPDIPLSDGREEPS